MNCDSFLSCVADPTRHAILRHLAAGPSHVGPLATAIGIEQSNTSHHLRQLRECGFVTFERDGKANRYRLACSEVGDFLRAIDTTQAAVAKLAGEAEVRATGEADFAGPVQSDRLAERSTPAPEATP